MIRMPRPVDSPFVMNGGLDTETPPMELKPGFVRDGLNYECGVNGGYARIDGYERFDGQLEPHLQLYYTLPVTFSSTYTVGDTITGVTSGKTAVIVAGDADNLYICKATGAFAASEPLNISGSPIGTVDSTQTLGGAPTKTLDLTYLAGAADQYRADITTVPGSGNILGLGWLNDVLYAFRNASTGTESKLYKSSASGWVNVDLNYEIIFSAGSGNVLDNDTLTQSGVTTTILRVVVESGTLGAGTAAGRLIITAPAGGNYIAGAATTSSGGTLTLSGVETAITLSPNGRYEITTYNFGGQSGTKCLYGCDGVNRAFEFDGAVFVPIKTGMSPDTPTHIAAHQNHLFLSFGSSAQHSSIGDPYQWSPITGADEIAIGDDITGFAVQRGNEGTAALAIAARNMLDILYGTDSSTWSKVSLQTNVGALPNTIQEVGMTYMLDDLGILPLGASAKYGNFEHSTLSRRFSSHVALYRPYTVASSVARDKNQYRLFFTGGRGLYLTVEGTKLRGAMPIQFNHSVTCTCSGEDSNGNSVNFFGSSNGYVYRMDVGTSFDGEEIPYSLTFAYNHLGSPRVLKQFKRVYLELFSSSEVSINFGYLLGYGASDISQGEATAAPTTYNPMVWDEFTWDAFYWDGATAEPSRIPISGTAENISIAINGLSAIHPSHTLYGAVVQHIPRRGSR